MPSPPPRPDIPELSKLPLVVDTPRLRLRPIALEDAERLWPFVSDPLVSRYLAWSAHESLTETRTFIAAAVAAMGRGSEVVWIIEHGGQVGGCIGLHNIAWTYRAWRIDRAELGYWLAPPLWGQGLMTEAASAATRWGFEVLGLHKITIGHVGGNTASKRIIEKIGYRYLARFEEDAWRDGRWLQHHRYEMTAGEWASRRG
jgi:ribosomal-protein-alanine N-acetyltransferase